MRKLLASVPLLFLVGCSDGGSSEETGTPSAALKTPATFTYCCDPGDVPVAVGEIGVENTSESEIGVEIDAPSTLQPEDEEGHAYGFFGPGPYSVAAGETIGFTLVALACVEADQVVTVRAIDPETDDVVDEWTVTVRWDCPEPPPPPPPPAAEITEVCGSSTAERLEYAESDDWDEPGVGLLTAGAEGGALCYLEGSLGKEVPLFDFNGCTTLCDVPLQGSQLAQLTSDVPSALCFYGPGRISITSWVASIHAFGAITNAGVGSDNWTDVAAAGDRKATNLFLAVSFTNRTIGRIEPQSFSGYWGYGGPDIVPSNIFDAAWGGPVSACRLERTGDIATVHEPSLTDPGNFVVVFMGGDDAADSATLVGQTGRQPRVLRGLDGVFGVTCYGENVLSLFRKTATGYEKVGDETVGDGPLGLAVKKLANGNVAFLSTGSRDDTWSITIVDPATGAVVSTTTKPVPAALDEPTDCAWGAGDDVYLIGKASQNIARIDSGAE